VAETKVQYIVEVSKTGTGAADAAKELNELKNSAEKAAGSAQNVSGQFATLNTATHGTKDAFQALRNSVTLIGFSSFPDLTTKGMAAVEMFKGLRGAAVATGTGLASTSLIIAGFTGLIASATEGWKAYKAAQNEAFTAANLGSQQNDIRARLIEIIEQNRGRLQSGEADRMINKLQSSPPEILEDRIGSVRNRLRDVVGTESQIAAAEKLAELQRQMSLQQLDGLEAERVKAYELYAERIRQIEDLAAKSGRQSSREDVESAKQVAGESLRITVEGIKAKETEAKMQELAQQQELARANLRRMAATDLRRMEQELTIQNLESSEDRIALAEREFSTRINFYEELVARHELDEEELTDLTNNAVIQRLQAFKQAEAEKRREATKTESHLTQMQQMGLQIGRQFTDGLGTALVDSFEKGGAAFQQFAANFLKRTAEMLAQAAMFRIFSSLFGGTSIGSFFFGASGAAQGGVFPRMMATGGIQTVSSATYFPRFNVVAGEAGAEMMAVLSKPRMMNLGGIEAAVGSAQGNRLAIASADALASRGAGGAVQVHVTLDPGLRAEIVQNSVQGAVVQVTRDVKRNTALRAAVRGA